MKIINIRQLRVRLSFSISIHWFKSYNFLAASYSWIYANIATSMRLLVFPQMNSKITEKLNSNCYIYCLCKNLRYLYKCNRTACWLFTENIAFHARQWTDLKNIKDKTVVVFSDVTLNTRNAYSASTGEFTAPVRGHYTFTLIISTTQGALFSTQLAINGNSVSCNHIKGVFQWKKNYEILSSTGISKMETNDVVTIRLFDTGVFANKMWSSFSGFFVVVEFMFK